METIYCVSGATGHLGTTVVKQLLAMKKNVRIFVLSNDTHYPKEGVDVCVGDVRNQEDIDAFLHHRADERLIVIHCAGIVSIASAYNQTLVDVNVTGTKNMVESCITHQVSKLLYVSSVHAITEKKNNEVMKETHDFNPDTVNGLYAKTKAEATAYVLAAADRGLCVNVVFPSGLCGPNDYGNAHMTSLVIDYMKGRLTAGMRGGYDFVDVRDVAQAIIRCADDAPSGEVYILSNQIIKVSTIFDMLYAITNKRKIKTFLPLGFVKATAKLSEMYYRIRKKPPLFTPYSIDVLGSNARFSHEKATHELDYHPRDFEETLRDTVKWLHEHQRF